ncbi:sialate O-acetylesterase [Chitinophaga sp. MM2321]|uniref:sialate O-acetylesterase n=1 Tax=Chitinophaga sp. MM2321 TaxID=3137178 RepID=UPI0032D58E50
MKQTAVLILLLLVNICTYADVRMPHIFGDNMVLQRDKPIQIWGWADAGEKITVSFHQQKKKATANKQGRWLIKLEIEKAGGPYTLQVEGKNKVMFNNVLVGEVWFCSGQSNMALPVHLITNAVAEADSADYPQIRHFYVPNKISATPEEDIEAGAWTVCNPSTVSNFTAVGYLFAKELSRKLNVPVGIINSSWGATVSETWTSREALAADDAFKELMAATPPLDSSQGDRYQAFSTNPSCYPSLLFNAMVHPFLNYGIKGILWYQGESNAGRAYQYRKAFPLLIRDWRNHWKEILPFYFVQISSFNAGNGDSQHGSTWAELREAQTMALSIPNTGMAVTIDIGSATEIHPQNKQDVARRLAATALHELYNIPQVHSGPAYKAMKTKAGQAIITFNDIGSGLMVKDRYGYIKGFEIAGADRKFHYAKAYLAGDSVIIYNEQVSEPFSVRYGWADDAGACSLYNIEGFPAGPFRVDNWPEITSGVKYSICE